MLCPAESNRYSSTCVFTSPVPGMFTTFMQKSTPIVCQRRHTRVAQRERSRLVLRQRAQQVARVPHHYVVLWIRVATAEEHGCECGLAHSRIAWRSTGATTHLTRSVSAVARYCHTMIRPHNRQARVSWEPRRPNHGEHCTASLRTPSRAPRRTDNDDL